MLCESILETYKHVNGSVWIPEPCELLTNQTVISDGMQWILSLLLFGKEELSALLLLLEDCIKFKTRSRSFFRENSCILDEFFCTCTPSARAHLCCDGQQVSTVPQGYVWYVRSFLCICWPQLCSLLGMVWHLSQEHRPEPRQAFKISMLSLYRIDPML